jgi:hypothetical protein
LLLGGSGLGVSTGSLLATTATIIWLSIGIPFNEIRAVDGELFSTFLAAQFNGGQWTNHIYDASMASQVCGGWSFGR